MAQPDRIRALIDEHLTADPDALVRDRLGARSGPWALPAAAARPPVPTHLLCPSCERNPITRNGRCEECQWAVS